MRISDWSSDVCSSDLFLRSGTVAVRLVRRSRAASLPEIEQRDAELAGLVGEVVLDARARKHDDADRQHVQHLIVALERSDEHTSELQSLMRISYTVFGLKQKITTTIRITSAVTSANET